MSLDFDSRENTRFFQLELGPRHRFRIPETNHNRFTITKRLHREVGLYQRRCRFFGGSNIVFRNLQVASPMIAIPFSCLL